MSDSVELTRTDELWFAQVGAALSQVDTAELLGKSPEAVQGDVQLIRLRTREGEPAYPIFQFDGRRAVPGISEVAQVLRSAVREVTIAAWLTAPHRRLGGAAPVQALRAGRREEVLELARLLAESAA